MKGRKSTLFLYYDPHYAHDAFARSLGADRFPAPRLRSGEGSTAYNTIGLLRTVSAAFKIPRDYDVYLCEGTYVFPALARKLHLIGEDAKIIDLLASPLAYYIKTGVVGGAKRSFALSLLKEVDGFVCVGRMERQLIEEILPGAKTIVTYPFVKSEVRRSLLSAKGAPDLGSKNILFIGKGDPYYKGIDLLIEAFKRVRKKWPDAELNIVGAIEGSEQYAKGAEGVSFLGFVKDLESVMAKSALYVHLGRGDSFPVSSMEAMLRGIPAIVSEWTGTKEIVQEAASGMVVPLDAAAASAAIDRYFSLPSRSKRLLSKKFRRAASSIKKDVVIKKFVKDYRGLICGEK